MQGQVECSALWDIWNLCRCFTAHWVSGLKPRTLLLVVSCFIAQHVELNLVRASLCQIENKLQVKQRLWWDPAHNYLPYHPDSLLIFSKSAKHLWRMKAAPLMQTQAWQALQVHLRWTWHFYQRPITRTKSPRVNSTCAKRVSQTSFNIWAPLSF